MKISAPRGTVDVLPENSYKWRFVENAARKIADLFNYSEIRTPVFEQTELFVRGIGNSSDIVRKEMYTFADKKGRSMTLRPEGTATVMRAVAEHKLYAAGVSKLFYIGPFFRYERPQAGRYRQFHQFGLEGIGSESPLLDGEIIHATYSFFASLGLKELKVQLNSLGCGDCRLHYREALTAYLQKNREELCGDCGERFSLNPLRILDCKNPRCREIVADSPLMLDFLCGGCREHFDGLVKFLEAVELPYVINARIVRGLDYYTRTVFEIVSRDLGAQDALCGGGRYDLLGEEIGGRKIPAVGVAMGLERTIAIMEKLGLSFGSPHRPQVYVAALDAASSPAASAFLAELRRAGVSAERDYAGKGVKAQLKDASALGCRFAALFGENERAARKAAVKDMESGVQEEIPVAEAVSYLLDRLQPGSNLE